MNNYGMTYNITRQGMLDLFHTCICSGSIGFGSIHLDAGKEAYREARKRMTDKNPELFVCVEDVLKQILFEGYELSWYDVEDEDETKNSFGLEDLMNNFKNVEPHLISEVLSEQDDQVTHDSILQCLLLGEIVYG